MSPVEAGGRHYRGPEQPKEPPMPMMPPAEELLQDEPPALHHDADVIEAAFSAWLDTMQGDPLSATMQMFGLVVFKAGAEWQRTHGQAARPTELPLEGTVESRTIIAALEMFKSQVLLENPPEVKSGEWLNPRDVDVLIQGIRANAAKGR